MARILPTPFVFQPVQLVRPAEIVAYRISEAIRAGDVRVGDRLPSEQNLSTQLGISRPTLREAIKLLAQAGVLSVRPGSSGGIFVVSQSVPSELCGLPLPELPMEDIAGVMEARRLIEPQVARMAAAYGTPADFKAMHDAVAVSAAAGAPYRRKRITQEGVELMTIASTRFNLAVARATQNSVIVQMMEILLRRMEPVRMLALAELPDITLSTRTLMNSLAAIESGDPELIDKATRERVGLLEAAWERATGKKLRRRPLLRVVADDFSAPQAGAAPAPELAANPRSRKKKA
ncbi:MAG: FadR family transcriptional regulator [Polaromonas sp.]|uniref:FadR/GntR family transcriptional regulator n=1 Tax=Polaromonas sp. TaxID=1869339 RepID=UPI00403714C6|nr:FadR family transcriptional regulator [Polaromonas sp.]